MPMTNKTEKMERLGIKKAPGYLYFISKKGHVMRVRMTRGRGAKKNLPEMVQEMGITRKFGYLYFLDKQGDISRVRMVSSNNTGKRYRKRRK